MVALNNAQKEASLHTHGPLLIIAGAGAGKTKTVTERIRNLIRSGVSPSSILAVTFTNKAAKEMRERVMEGLRVDLGDSSLGKQDTPCIRTFHSLGVLILSEQSSLAGLSRHPTILDTSDTNSLIRDIVSSFSLDPKIHDPSKIKHIISREKGDFQTPDTYEAKIYNTATEVIARVWRRYEEELKIQKAVDFDDLIVKTVKLLEENPQVRQHYQERFKYIHIDEYQDTNRAQYELVKQLVDEVTRNICAVGDTDQNIYSWRGANIRNILNFERDFPGTTLIRLEQNYRSTGNILLLANETIRHNTVRQEKTLFTEAGAGELITVQPCFDESAEASWVAHEVKKLLEDAASTESIAILYRANFQSRILEESFLIASIPYTLLGTKFFERKEVKDVLSYLRVLLNRDSLTDLRRVFETPKRGIGKVTLAKLFAKEELPRAASLKVQEVFTFLTSLEGELPNTTLSQLLTKMISTSGIEAELLKGGEDGEQRLENIRELVSISKRYDTLKAEESLPLFLEEASLHSDQDDSDTESTRVRMMTVHASKGLEFDHVFVVGLEDELFPHKNVSNARRSQEENEEERRLFYVAVTRAKKKLYLSHAELRTIYGQKRIEAPSEFLTDVPTDILDLQPVYYEQLPREPIVYF